MRKLQSCQGCETNGISAKEDKVQGRYDERENDFWGVGIFNQFHETCYTAIKKHQHLEIIEITIQNKFKNRQLELKSLLQEFAAIKSNNCHHPR